MINRIPIEETVLTFLQEYNLVIENKPLVIGVSGGPDSTCLLHIIAGLRNIIKTEVHIAHLNHVLRGFESDGDAEYVLSQSKQLDIPATVESQDVVYYQKNRRLSLEEAAREVRYAFFARVARSLDTNTVLIAHNANDQIETILMHLVRGTGLTGLRGMKPLSVYNVSDGTQLYIARPLLNVTREEIEAYCVSKQIYPRIDSSNKWQNQLRNQIRSQLIPLLHRYNVDIDKALLRTARTVDADLDYLEKEVSQLWGSVIQEQPDGGISINRDSFARLHLSMKRHIIRSALQRLLGDLQNIEAVHIENLIEILSKPAGKSLSLPRGLSFHGNYGHGLITPKKAISCPFPELKGEHAIRIPGETVINGWLIKATIHAHTPVETNGRRIKAHLDLDSTGEKLIMRARKRGDRFQPLGMEQEKKLQDFMVDAKIPQDWRDRIPIVCSPQHIVWVMGWRIDNRARVLPTTRHVLELEFKQI